MAGVVVFKGIMGGTQVGGERDAERVVESGIGTMASGDVHAHVWRLFDPGASHKFFRAYFHSFVSNGRLCILGSVVCRAHYSIYRITNRPAVFIGNVAGALICPPKFLH